MSAMLAMSFDELQSDVIPREVFDQYRCIWKTGNDRCESVLTDQNSLATLRSILTSPKSWLDDKMIQHAGHLSLCPDHGDVICLGDVFNTYWMHDIASDVDFSGPQTPFQHNPGSAGNDASPGDIPARQSQTLPSPPTGSPNPSRPHGIVTVSESAVPRLAGPPSPTVTHLPRHARPSRASSAFTTPTRDSRRVVSTPVSQPSGRKSSITSPSCLASASGRRNTYNYPLFSTLQAEFRNNDLKEYRCLAKRGSGRCKNMIDNDETLDQVRRITAEPITRLTPDDVREVNRLLTCAEGVSMRSSRGRSSRHGKTSSPDSLVTSEHCFFLDLSHAEGSHLRKRHPLVTLNSKEESDARHAWTWAKVQTPIHAMHLARKTVHLIRCIYDLGPLKL